MKIIYGMVFIYLEIVGMFELREAGLCLNGILETLQKLLLKLYYVLYISK